MAAKVLIVFKVCLFPQRPRNNVSSRIIGSRTLFCDLIQISTADSTELWTLCQ